MDREAHLFTFCTSYRLSFDSIAAMAKNSTNSTAGLAQPTFDFGDVPATPPAHIWAFKALRNGLLGTRPSPLVAPLSPQDDIDEVAQVALWN